MQTNLLWTGRGYYSLENCLVNTTEEGSVITSTIIGYYEERIYIVDYQITTNHRWETLSVEINARHSNQIESIKLASDGKGNWTSHGKPAGHLKGCIDVDISLTPLTNTLAINRLRLAVNEGKKIHVVYFDLLSNQIKPVHQKYIKLSDSEYKYENVPNDFEAKIQVDDAGFVVDYPMLFVRTAASATNYR